MSDILALFRSRLSREALGVEIGAHSLPVPGVEPYYVDRVSTFAGTNTRVDIQADAVALPFPSEEIDYLCSSHVLEHLVNPVSGLLEWHRVLRSGGWLYLVVPDKRFTFDEPRSLTPPSHIVRDFEKMTDETELEHIREFIYDTDWTRLQPEVNNKDIPDRQKALFQAYVDAVNRGESIDVHHHTFTPESLHEMLQRSGLIGGPDPSFELEAEAEKYPEARGDGIGYLLRKIRRSKEEKPADTFRFARPSSSSKPIRLVCPATLAALTFVTAANAMPRLEASGLGHTFAFNNEVPVMLPPAGIPIQRQWYDERWRLARLSALEPKPQP